MIFIQGEEEEEEGEEESSEEMEEEEMNEVGKEVSGVGRSEWWGGRRRGS